MTMLRLLCFFLIVLAVASCAETPPPVVQTPAPVNEEYRLGVGDVISIRVYGGEEEQRFDRIRLNDRGRLALPFADVTAVGRTTAQVESQIIDAVKGRFLRNPRVWVNIDEYRPFFMQGQVARPGAFPYQPGLNVSRAVIIAGGFRERAAKNRIFIVRDEDKANKPARADLNTWVKPGDTVIVEESLF